MQAYPLQIRTILRTGKSRSQPAAFRMAEPRRGYAYTQATGTDTAVFWDVSFCFTRPEALIFQLWGTQLLNNWQDEFTMPIKTEFGQVSHTCRFLPDNLMPSVENGELWTYSATIMARALLIPYGYAEAADLIVTLPDWDDWASQLDQAVTAEMPT